jgi:hypothetical protein
MSAWSHHPLLQGSARTRMRCDPLRVENARARLGPGASGSAGGSWLCSGRGIDDAAEPGEAPLFSAAHALPLTDTRPAGLLTVPAAHCREQAAARSPHHVPKAAPTATPKAALSVCWNVPTDCDATVYSSPSMARACLSRPRLAPGTTHSHSCVLFGTPAICHSAARNWLAAPSPCAHRSSSWR